MKGKTINWTIEEVNKKLAAGKIRGIINKNVTQEKRTKKSKYGNKKTEVDGIVFHSQREADRWAILKLLVKAGEIGFLERQVPYELNEGGTHSLKYYADFRYITKAGETVVEDAKGAKTKVYLKKRRLMKKIYGITIKET